MAKVQTRAQKLVELITTYGVQSASDIVDASDRTGLPLANALAMIMMESGGANLFGGDPTTSIPQSWKGTKVTRIKYAYYKARRARYGLQGIGPCQLTALGVQQEAERLGGCWKPLYNCVVGFTDLRQQQALHGIEGGYVAYNGSGALAIEYGHRAMAWLDTWTSRLGSLA